MSPRRRTFHHPFSWTAPARSPSVGAKFHSKLTYICIIYANFTHGMKKVWHDTRRGVPRTQTPTMTPSPKPTKEEDAHASPSTLSTNHHDTDETETRRPKHTWIQRLVQRLMRQRTTVAWMTCWIVAAVLGVRRRQLKARNSSHQSAQEVPLSDWWLWQQQAHISSGSLFLISGICT